jgi:hypothetical protein
MKTNKILLHTFPSTILWILGCGLLFGFRQPMTNPTLSKTPTSTAPSDSVLVNGANPNGLESEPTAIDNTTAADTTIILLPKPTPLEPIPAAYPDPLPELDILVTKQLVKIAPYVPFVQEIFIGLDYGKLAMNAWQALRHLKNKAYNQEHQYEGKIGIIFRKNIQLSSNLGYAHLHPTHTSDNRAKYEVQGLYGRMGIDYVVRYDARNNLYAGLRYGRSHFTNRTKSDNPNSKGISKVLTASWFEIGVGAEYQLWKDHGFYAGLAFQLSNLYHFTQFEPANNYVIPGYGRTKNKTSIGLSLYIQYHLSFLNRLIAFN